LFSADGIAEYAGMKFDILLFRNRSLHNHSCLIDDVVSLEADVNAALKSCSRVRGKKQEALALQEEFRATLNEAFEGIFDSEATPQKQASNKRGRDPDDAEAVAPPKRSASKRSAAEQAVGGLSSEDKVNAQSY